MREGPSAVKMMVAMSVAATALLAACGGGGGGDDDALRKEVAALREQLASTSTTTMPVSTTVTTEAPTTTTTQAPVPTTKAATATTQRVTPTTQPAAPTTTVPPPTTTTTVPYVRPQGTVTWSVKDMRPTTNNCVAFTYTVFNRSDSALMEVGFANVYNQEGFPGADGKTQYRWGNPTLFPKQTVAAGIAPFGQGDLTVNWCPTSITPGSTSQFPVHIGEGRMGTNLTTSVSWTWFSTYPGTNNHATGCCAWWDNATKTGHE